MSQHHWHCCWCSGFGSTLPLVEQTGSSLVCLKHTSFPSASYLSNAFTNKKKLLYMYEEGVLLCCIQWGLLWRTSLGSKPGRDSCLVNHLNMMIPLPSTAPHSTTFTKFSLTKSLVNNIICCTRIPRQQIFGLF